MEKTVLSGNEAIARGAFEAGVKVASAYPGTPSTEILENLTRYRSVDASWAPNEKVALEVAIGASFAGARALAAMKHVGVNVAADPLFTLAYTGVRGGLVLVTADDPELHSSQNEQDNRNYAKFAKVPMFEPSDSQDALDFTRLAFSLSESWDMPVMLRTTTRISHAKSVVSLGDPVSDLPPTSLQRNPPKFVMLPGNARLRHPDLEARLIKLADWAADQPFNRIEEGKGEVGVITSGISYQYAKEVFPEAHILKLGLIHPLPRRLITTFAERCRTLYVLEELDPFLEEQIRAMGISVHGKDIFPQCGELTPGRIKAALQGTSLTAVAGADQPLTSRPPNMCPGCAHRGVFYSLNRLKAFVAGDIGCYTLGFMPPLSAMDTCICMGASIGNASGLVKALDPEQARNVVAVIGDSTFLHTGINGLMEMVYNGSTATVIILDNRTTAMTGRQENPGSGYTLRGEPSRRVDFVQLCRSLGVQRVRTIDPYDLDATKSVIQEEMAASEVSIIITQRPCMLGRRDFLEKRPPLFVDPDKCTGCKACLRIGCPAITWEADAGEKGQARIDKVLCVGCGVCQQLCRFDAFGVHDE